MDNDAWAAGWTHRFTGWLQAAVDGPLHTGVVEGLENAGYRAHVSRYRRHMRITTGATVRAASSTVAAA